MAQVFVGLICYINYTKYIDNINISNWDKIRVFLSWLLLLIRMLLFFFSLY